MRTGSASRNSPPLGFLKTSPKNGSSYKPSRILSSLGILDKDTITGKNRRKSRKGGGGLSPKMTDSVYKKRGVDFTDFAYREAVNRLKYLLAESYTPTKMPQYHHRVGNDSADDTDYQSSTERPVLSEISKYFPQSSALTHFNTKRMMNEYPQGGTTKENFPLGLKPAYSTSSLQQSEIAQFTDVTNPPPPQELMNFIERQESYIEQLEKESQFCREELANLLSKVKNVITENETLTDQAKVGLTRTFFSNLDSSESDGEHGEGGKGLQMKYRQPKNLSFGPNIVFESRISELEAQLAQSAIDFKRLTEENESNKRKIALGVADTGSADIYRKQIDDLQKDKAMQEETIRKLQMHINEMKEADSFSKGQRARDFTEQVAFERAQAEIEIRRLKDELERQHERVREIQNEMARRISDERTNAERRYNYQVDQLGGDLTSQWETASKLQLELERQKRMETDCKRDLMQKNVQIDELKAEIKNKTAAWLSDVAQMNAEKQSLEQEITSLRMQLERAERQGKVETSRLNAEVNSLRQRLDRSDGDLLHARRENLRLSDQISALEKEIALGEIAREPRPKEMSKIITDMEAKHAAYVQDGGNIHGGGGSGLEYTAREEPTPDVIVSPTAHDDASPERSYTKQQEYTGISGGGEPISRRMEYNTSPPRGDKYINSSERVEVEKSRADERKLHPNLSRSGSRQSVLEERGRSEFRSSSNGGEYSSVSREGSRSRRDDAATLEGGNEERTTGVELQPEYDGAGELGQFGGASTAVEYTSGGDYTAAGGEIAGDTFEPQYDATTYGQQGGYGEQQQAQYEQYDSQQYGQQGDYGYGDQQYQQEYDPNQYVQYSGEGYDQQQPVVTYAESSVAYGIADTVPSAAASAGVPRVTTEEAIKRPITGAAGTGEVQQIYAESPKGTTNVGNTDSGKQPTGKLLSEQFTPPVAPTVAATRTSGGNGAKFTKR
ncbi:plectin isoform X6 [Lutzomyia longipalpis]|uniref:plectin isoform X6 n=1 Tax=Lutzomyia longipalpis TaxID=7200 RepID=UPI0024841ED4|nr:plectin isoform X6 [Lutzomyia longipalpis]